MVSHKIEAAKRISECYSSKRSNLSAIVVPTLGNIWLGKLRNTCRIEDQTSVMVTEKGDCESDLDYHLMSGT